MAVAGCPECPGRRPRFFSFLRGEQRARFERVRVSHRYRHGQVLFYEGTPALAVYCIRSGRVKLFKVGGRDEEIVVGTCEGGDLVGLDAVPPGSTHGATAEALEDVLACAIPREAVVELLEDCPRLSLGLLEEMSRRCRQAEEQLVQRTHRCVAQRIARFLLDLLGNQHGDPPTVARVEISMRREEIARLIGTSPETLSRTLHRLSVEGVLGLGKSGIEILDLGALKRLGDPRT